MKTRSIKEITTTRSGFTIIETTLSMAFISVLLLMTTFLIIQMSAIYQKTLTVKAVNTTAQELIDDISRHIRASTIVSANAKCSMISDTTREDCEKDAAFKYIYRQYDHDFGDGVAVPTNGIFCSGLYSYIWNTGYAFKLDKGKNFRAVINGNPDYRFVRAFDPGGELCMANVNDSTYEYNPTTISPSYSVSEPEELLSASESDLAIYDFRIFHPARHAYSGQAYYAGTFILATLQGDVDIMSSGEYCKASNEAYFDEFTYCALNKYNFAAQATGETDE